MTYILATFGVVILLVALGEVVGKHIPLLKRMPLPGAVLGGLIGLSIGPELLDLGSSLNIETTTQHIYKEMGVFPMLFINIVFACLMLGKRIDKPSRIWSRARPHIVIGHIIAWGQYVVGIILTLFILSPYLSVDPLVAPSIAIGFQGGHGTAAGLTSNYETFDFSEGKTIAYSIATVGVFLATVVAPLLAKTLSIKETDIPSELQNNEQKPDEERKTFSGSTSSLTMHFALIALTIVLSKLFLDFSIYIESILRPQSDQLFTQFIPLFSVVLISGLFVQLLLQKFNWSHFFRRSLFNKISAFGLDIVIVSALTVLSLGVVQEYWVTILLLVFTGFGWNLAIFFFLGPRLFKRPWTPYALSDLGGGTGTTASGLMLIRIVDPKYRTNAQQSYSEKQPFYEPIMGGGLVTAMALPLVVKLGLLSTLFITGGILLTWLVYAAFLIRKT